MSERPTPETDAFTTSFTSIDDPEGKKRWVPSDFARVLERQRDEARNKMADALQEVDLRTLDFERMKQELHEARAEAARWEAIAFWEASANSSTKKELHSTDPMWQKPLSTGKHIPHAPNP